MNKDARQRPFLFGAATIGVVSLLILWRVTSSTNEAAQEANDQLNRPTDVELFETPLEEVLGFFSSSYSLTFQNNVSGNPSVTYTNSGVSVGQALSEMLETVNCEYEVLSDGKVVIQRSHP